MLDGSQLLVLKPAGESTYSFVLSEFQATAFHLLNVWALLIERVPGAHRLLLPSRPARARLTAAMVDSHCLPSLAIRLPPGAAPGFPDPSRPLRVLGKAGLKWAS